VQPRRPNLDHMPRIMPPTRSHAWREVGLARQLSAKAVKRARVELAILATVLSVTLVLYSQRRELFGLDLPIRIITVVVLVILGWAIARDVGRALAPALFRRLDPGTAGTVGFLMRLGFMGLVLLVALRVAGLSPREVALGGAFTAVVIGLAAQQTLGNLFAGTVLLSARPFRVGERVRLQGGGLAGEIEGTVSALGLLYTTFANGEDLILVPNNVVLSVAVIPLREPAGIDVRVRLRPGVTPIDVQNVLLEEVTTPIRGEPRITLEELDDDEIIVRVAATPQTATDGPALASEVLTAIGPLTQRVQPTERGTGERAAVGRDGGA
jgi:small-conductance mechanosensitive channel